MKVVFLGIGTNLGDREANLMESVQKVNEYIGHTLQASSVYETEPWGFNSEDQFLNMVLKVETELDPAEILEKIRIIESVFGRTRDEGGYSSRVIDIDILLFGNLVMNEADLEIPHPHLHERMFVLVPLCEIAPGIIHPVFKSSLAELLKLCNDRGRVRIYQPLDRGFTSLSC